MSKKVFWAIVIPALLLIGGYIALQVFLRKGQNAGSDNQQAMAQSTGAWSGKAAAKSAATNDAGEEAREEKNGQATANKKEDSASGDDSSPLDLRPLFIEKMQQLVKKSSNGLYNLSIGDMEVDVLASTISLKQVSLQPDKRVQKSLQQAGLLPPNVIRTSFESLQIDGINLDDAIASKSMDYKLVKLVNPVIEIERYAAKSKKSGDGDFSQRFLQQMEKLAIGQLQVTGGQITVHDKAKGGMQKLQQVGVTLKNILLNDATRNDKSRFLFAKEARLEFHNLSMKTPDGLYTFKIGDAFVKATEKQVVLKNVSYQSSLTKEAFMKKQKVAKEMYTVLAPSLTINDIDWWPAFNGEQISAGNVLWEGGQLAVYYDRSLPPKNKMGNFPSQMLSKVPLRVDVDKFKTRGLRITYEEFNPKSGQSGTVLLDNVEMEVTNISNRQKKSDSIVVNGTALLMHEVPLKARFVFDMAGAKEGKFSARLATGAFEGDVLNAIAKPLGMLKVNEGTVQAMQVNMAGNEMGARGQVTLQYDKLNVSMLKKKQDGRELQKRPLISFLANVFVLKNDNPWWPTDKLRKKEAQFQRDPQAGFMNLVWKTALVGLLKTIGAPEKMATKK